MANDDPFKSIKESAERHVARRRSVLGLGARPKPSDEEREVPAGAEPPTTDKWTKKDTKVVAVGGAVGLATNILTGDPSTSLLAKLVEKHRAPDSHISQAPAKSRNDREKHDLTAPRRGPISSVSPTVKGLFEQAEAFTRISGGGLLCDAAKAIINRQIVSVLFQPMPTQARYRKEFFDDLSGVSFTTWPPLIFGPDRAVVKFVHLHNEVAKLCDQMLALPRPPVMGDHGKRLGLLMDVTKSFSIRRNHVPITGEAMTLAEFWASIVAPDFLGVPAWERDEADKARAIPFSEIWRLSKIP